MEDASGTFWTRIKGFRMMRKLPVDFFLPSRNSLLCILVFDICETTFEAVFAELIALVDLELAKSLLVL